MTIIFKAAGILIGILILLQIWVSHTIITQGANLKKLEGLQRDISEENMVIENEIATTAALINIATAASSLGFSSPRGIQYIK
jgi:hypothetical protein